MSRIGGESVCKTVKNVMAQTIGDELAQIYTWTGQKKKMALKKTKVSDVIIGIPFYRAHFSILNNMSFKIKHRIVK